MEINQPLKQDFIDALAGVALFTVDSSDSVKCLDGGEIASEMIEVLIDRMQLQGFPESVIDALLGDREEASQVAAIKHCKKYNVAAYRDSRDAQKACYWYRTEDGALDVYGALGNCWTEQQWTLDQIEEWHLQNFPRFEVKRDDKT